MTVHRDPPGRRSRTASVVAAVIAGSGTAMLAAGIALPMAVGAPGEGPILAIMAGALLLVGGMLAVRRPLNAVCWLILLPGTMWAGLALTSAYARYAFTAAPAPPPGTTFAYWLATWLWIPGLILLPVFVPLLFPDGRLPSPRWIVVLRCGVAGLALVLLAQWTNVWGPSGYEYEWAPATLSNPLHLAALDGLRAWLFGLGGVLLLATAVAGLVSAVVRFRRSHGIERQQLRWVLFGVLSGLSLYGLAVAIELVTPLEQRVADVGITLALLSFPASIAVAVLRFRLYDLERIVSRTVSYTAVLLLLAGVYAAGVVGLTTLLGSLTGGGGGDLAVAGSTLVVAALFRPVTRRMRELVDRRFNRSRLDAVRTVERFSHRLRHEVALEVVGRELVGCAVVAVQPRSAHIWVPPRFRNASGTVGVHDGAVTPEALG